MLTPIKCSIGQLLIWVCTVCSDIAVQVYKANKVALLRLHSRHNVEFWMLSTPPDCTFNYFRDFPHGILYSCICRHSHNKVNYVKAFFFLFKVILGNAVKHISAFLYKYWSLVFQWLYFHRSLMSDKCTLEKNTYPIRPELRFFTITGKTCGKICIHLY